MTATPPAERHGLPALMAAACLREDRWLVHHLAADLPVAEVIGLAADTGADLVVLSSATSQTARAARRAAREIGFSAPGLRVLGRPGDSLSLLRELARGAAAPRRLRASWSAQREPLGEGRELVALLGQVGRGGPDHQAVYPSRSMVASRLASTTG